MECLPVPFPNRRNRRFPETKLGRRHLPDTSLHGLPQPCPVAIGLHPARKALPVSPPPQRSPALAYWLVGAK